MTQVAALNLLQFKELLHSLGADVSRWPDPAAAYALLEQSEEARALLAQEQPVDALLRPDAAEKAPDGLLDRIMDATDPKKH